MGEIDMKKAVLYATLCTAAVLARTAGVQGATPTTNYDKAIDPYVQFLQQQKQTPVDYLVGLFQTYDLVVLCERSHPEVTQYDMIYELAADRRFQQQAGHIFMENGTRTLQPAVESFLTDDTLSEPQAQEKLRLIFRNFDWSGTSSQTNVYGFLQKIRGLNRSLPKDERVHLYPSDLDFDWSRATKESYSTMCQQLGRRDRIMADHVVAKFNEIRQSAVRNKALVIMNYRHAFPHIRVERGGRSKTFENMTGFLMAAYPGRVANVMINNVRPLPGSSDNQLVLSALQDGKWDAAFAVLGNPSLGFSFRSSPFGADDFDYFALPFPIGKTYQDVFTGYVFYKPPAEHRMSFSIPGLLDPQFADEMLRRCRIRGENRSAEEIAREIEQSQTTRTCGYEDKGMFPKSEYTQKIQQWLQPAGDPSNNRAKRPSAAAVAPSSDRSKRPSAAGVARPRRPAPRLRRY
jgi:hypothetical protein